EKSFFSESVLSRVIMKVLLSLFCVLFALVACQASEPLQTETDQEGVTEVVETRREPRNLVFSIVKKIVIAALGSAAIGAIGEIYENCKQYWKKPAALIRCA
ncbi:hypothetical protein QAD02_011190, partial [Eretmocerus hayati]